MSITAADWAHWPLPQEEKDRLVAEGVVVVRPS